MTDHPSQELQIDGARLIFRNFQGLERPFNSEGDRNFSVVLPTELAEELKAKGWRVKQTRERPDGTPGDYHLKVKVPYKEGRQDPRVVVINPGKKSRVEWGKDEVGMLDIVDIGNVDLIVNGWWSDMAGGGYSGFLRSIYVTLRQDPLEERYAHLDTQDPNTPAPTDAHEDEDVVGEQLTDEQLSELDRGDG